MSDIKFRVWCPIRKIFVACGMTPLELMEDSSSDLELMIIVSEKDKIWQENIRLKDRGKKEIYVGDIVRLYNTNDPKDGYQFQAPIKYRPEIAGYSFYVPGKPAYRQDLHLFDEAIKYPEGITGNGRTCKIASNRLEIVGNIFENPELLK